MKRKYRILGFALLIQAFVIYACSTNSISTTTPILAPIRTLAETLASPTSELSPTNTHIAEITSTKTREPFPTSHSTRTLTPTPTQMIWTSIELPDWADDQEIPILLGVYGHHPDFYDAPSKSLAMWNGLTGEQFDLIVPDAVGFYWLPNGLAFGLLSKDLTKAWEVELARGLVTTVDVPTSSIEFTYTSDTYFTPLKVLSIPGQTGYSYRHSDDEVSADGRFVVESTYDHNILVYDSFLGETFNLAAPNNQLFYIMAYWSPVEPYLAVLRSDKEIGLMYSTDGPANWSIAIYDVLKRQLLEVYDDMFWVNWSPDGTKFLYQPPSEMQVWEEPMCVLDRFSGESKCFEAPFIKHKTSSSDDIDFWDLRWLPDSRSFSYLYYTYGFHNGVENVKGGICFLTIEGVSEHCILEQLEQDEGVIGEGPYTVRYYWPSPDWRVLLFETDTACPLCDYSDDPRLGFVDIQTGQFIMLDVYLDGFLSLWRP